MNLSESALAQSVVASLSRARLRYIEGLIILKSGLKAAAVIRRGCRLGRGGLDCAVSPPNLCHNLQPLLVFPLGQTIFFAGYAGHLPARIAPPFGRPEPVTPRGPRPRRKP